MELRHLRYFVAVAEELSFTRAAARLRTAQPSLSQQIRRLEQSVGVALLDRSRHHVMLTDAGRVFLQQAKNILARVEHSRRLAKQAAAGRAGEVAVGTFPSADVRIIPALRALVAERLPDVRLVLHSKYGRRSSRRSGKRRRSSTRWRPTACSGSSAAIAASVSRRRATRTRASPLGAGCRRRGCCARV